MKTIKTLITSILLTIFVAAIAVGIVKIVHITGHNFEAKIFKAFTGQSIQEAVDNVKRHKQDKQRSSGNTGQMPYGLDKGDR